MATLTVYEAMLTAREINFPSECPKCSTSFLEGANLIQYAILDCEALTGDLDGDGFEVADNGEPLEETNSYPTSYACAHCATMIVPGKVEIREVARERPADARCEACAGRGWLLISRDTSCAHIEACDDCKALDDDAAITAARLVLGTRQCAICDNMNPCPTHFRS